MKNVAKSTPTVEFCCDDPNLTPAASLISVAELDRVIAMTDVISREVGSLYRPEARWQPYSAGEVVMSVVESQLAGGDFLCDIDYRRADDAGSALRAVARPPASTTVGYLGQRFDEKRLSALEAANAIIVGRMFDILPEKMRLRLLCTRPTIDLDPTDVEVYGKKKRGVAFNYAGERCGLAPSGGLCRGRDGAWR